jgi:hypothetical protein
VQVEPQALAAELEQRHHYVVIRRRCLELQELRHGRVHAEALLVARQHRVARVAQREDDLRLGETPA